LEGSAKPPAVALSYINSKRIPIGLQKVDLAQRIHGNF
jgi:hypothetical protein